MSAIYWFYQIFSFLVCIDTIMQNICLFFFGPDSIKQIQKWKKIRIIDWFFSLPRSIHSTACEAGLIDIQKCASPRVGESPRNTRRQRTISYPATLTNYKTFNSNGLESNNIAGKINSYVIKRGGGLN